MNTMSIKPLENIYLYGIFHQLYCCVFPTGNLGDGQVSKKGRITLVADYGSCEHKLVMACTTMLEFFTDS